MTRTAISPRFAIKTLENTLYLGRVDLTRARSALAGSRFADVEWVADTGSTNADLMAAARSGAGERVLGADHQTSGRGRLGRPWEAPDGASILMSILVRCDLGVASGHLVTTALGLAAVDAVEAVTDFHAGLKWPNDLVAVGAGPDGGDRKFAGVLAESVVVGDRLAAVVVGIGVNVNWPDDLPDELAEIATSLRHLVGHDVDRTDLVVAILRGFEHHVALVDTASGAELLRRAYLERSATVGRPVRVELGDRTITGAAVDVDVAGRLVVEADHQRHALSVGDVVHLRPLD